MLPSKNRFSFLVLFIAISGCGGGTQFLGVWECERDASKSLEIVRYEEYFLITARSAGVKVVREGIYANGVFSVGANSVGQPMGLEMVDGKIICTKPPNFCRCDVAFKSVEGLSIESTRANEALGKAKNKSPRNLEPPASKAQVLRKREPIVLDLHNGGSLTLFDDYRNEDYEQRMFDWPKLTYYYLPELQIRERSEGITAELRRYDDQVFIVFDLALNKLDRYELMEKVHANINQKILSEHVVPLKFAKILVTLPGNEAGAVSLDQKLLTGEIGTAREISFPITAHETSAAKAVAQAIVIAINEGSVLPRISFEIDVTSAPGDALQPFIEKIKHDWPLLHGRY